MLYISVFLAHLHKEESGHHDGKKFSRHDGAPHTVDLPEDGEDQNGDDLKDERAHKRDHRGNDAVSESREKGRSIDIEAHQKKSKGIVQTTWHKPEYAKPYFTYSIAKQWNFDSEISENQINEFLAEFDL